MIKAQHHWFYVRFFRLYTRWMLRWHFRKVIIKEDVSAQNKPVFLIGNHFSWWDGFFAQYLNEKLFHRRFHVMMLEEQLRPRMFLNKAGAFSIRKHSSGVMETIDYTRGLLNDPGNLVTMFPQGAIRSMFDFPVKFEKGPAKILQGMEEQVEVYFMAALVEYFSHRKPTLTLGVRKYTPEGNFRLSAMEDAYNQYLQEMIAEQKQ